MPKAQENFQIRSPRASWFWVSVILTVFIGACRLSSHHASNVAHQETQTQARQEKVYAETPESNASSLTKNIVSPVRAGPPDFYADTAETSWVVIKMHRVYSNGGRTDVELLRPKVWVTQRGLSEGGTFDFTASEESLSGRMIVDSIRKVEKDLEPLLQGADGKRMVTGRFVTTKAKTYTVSFADSDSDMRATGSHPLYSLDRNGWVEVAHLEPGERLRTQEGEIVVASIQAHGELETVYNLEVYGEHVYFVGNDRVLAHNRCETDILGNSLDGIESGDVRRAFVKEKANNFHPGPTVTKLEKIGINREIRAFRENLDEVGSFRRAHADEITQITGMPQGDFGDQFGRFLDIETIEPSLVRRANRGRLAVSRNPRIQSRMLMRRRLGTNIADTIIDRFRLPLDPIFLFGRPPRQGIHQAYR